ncbi:MAG: ATP-grasp domain-containing protein [Turicibacter sp.]
MQTIIFINCNKSGSSREAIKAACNMGYYTVLLTDRPSFLEFPENFPEINLIKKVDLQDYHQMREATSSLVKSSLNVKCIISFIDQYCYVAAKLAEEFGLNHFTTKAIMTMEDKLLSRKAVSKSPYGAYYLNLQPNETINYAEINRHLPLMVKSPNSAGSKDVYKINCMDDFNLCKKNLISKYPDEPILVEEFLDGPQYLVECVVINNNVHIIAIIEQEITYYNRFIITGYNLLLNSTPKFYNSLKKAVSDIIKLHGMETGTCHLEIRLVNNQWKLIETNPRISGGCMNEFLEVGLGINLVQETLKLALGEEPNLNFCRKNHTFAHYVILKQKGTLQKVLGKNAAIRSRNVKAVYVKPKVGALLTPPQSMGNRYAYVIAVGNTSHEAEQNAKTASSKIKFILSPYYTSSVILK